MHNFNVITKGHDSVKVVSGVIVLILCICLVIVYVCKFTINVLSRLRVMKLKGFQH